MQGYDGVLVLVPFGPIVSGAGTSIMMKGDTVSTMASEVDIAGTSQTVADDADNTTFYIDMKRPSTHRYVRLYVYRATTGTVERILPRGVGFGLSQSDLFMLP